MSEVHESWAWAERESHNKRHGAEKSDLTFIATVQGLLRKLVEDSGGVYAAHQEKLVCSWHHCEWILCVRYRLFHKQFKSLKQVLRDVCWPSCKDKGRTGGLDTTLDYVKNFWLIFFFPFGSSHHLEKVKCRIVTVLTSLWCVLEINQFRSLPVCVFLCIRMQCLIRLSASEENRSDSR